MTHMTRLYGNQVSLTRLRFNCPYPNVILLRHLYFRIINRAGHASHFWLHANATESHFRPPESLKVTLTTNADKRRKFEKSEPIRIPYTVATPCPHQLWPDFYANICSNMWHELSSNILSAARPCVAIILHSRYNFWGLALMARWREKEHESPALHI